jgi:hypothetical protein
MNEDTSMDGELGEQVHIKWVAWVVILGLGTT